MASRNKTSSGLGRDMTPSVQHVRIYMSQKGFSEMDTERFINTVVVRKGWKTQRGRPVLNWKQYLFQWQYILKNPGM